MNTWVARQLEMLPGWREPGEGETYGFPTRGVKYHAVRILKGDDYRVAVWMCGNMSTRAVVSDLLTDFPEWSEPCGGCFGRVAHP